MRLPLGLGTTGAPLGFAGLKPGAYVSHEAVGLYGRWFGGLLGHASDRNQLLLCGLGAAIPGFAQEWHRYAGLPCKLRRLYFNRGMGRAGGGVGRCPDS